MRRVLPHTVALWAVLASPAAAAQVAVDRTCHAPGQSVRLTATGLWPDAAFTAWRDRTQLGAGTVDDAGVASATFPAPGTEGEYLLRVFDAVGNRGRTTLLVRRPTVAVTPRPVDARTAVVRFRVDGLGAGAPPVWLHWVDPQGRHRRSVRLGTAAPPCGALVSEPRRLLPFRGVARGRWRLQLDTQKRYDPESRPRVVQRLRVTESP